MKKQIGIMKEVYDDLRMFRDVMGYPSFTEAIRELLRIYSPDVVFTSTAPDALFNSYKTKVVMVNAK